MLTLLFLLARLALSVGDYEVAFALSGFSPPSGRESEALYMRAVASHQLRDRQEAERAAQAVLDSFTPVERRHAVMAELILEDVRSWKPGLDETGRKMREVVGRLEVVKGGPITQAKQKAILEDLDDQIRKLEEADAQAKAAAAAAAARTAPLPVQSPALPQEGPAPGRVEDDILRMTPAQWGQLPEAERAKLVQKWAGECPPRYRADYEAYLKGLAGPTRR